MGLFVFTLFRTTLCLSNLKSLLAVEKWYLVFPIGLRMDTVLLCYALVLPLVLMLVLRARSLKWVLSLYFSAFLATAVFLEIATFPFMAEFNTRPDRLFIEHFGNWHEVLGMILEGYGTELATALLATALSVVLVVMLTFKTFKGYAPASFYKKLLLFVLCMPLVFLGARSSISHRAANISTAAFSNSHLINQLGLNSTYSLMYAWNSLKKHESDPARVYGGCPFPKCSSGFRNICFLQISMRNSSIPLLHTQTSSFPNQKPYNLVIILEESLGAEYVGCLGGLPLTPHLDRLARKGYS